MEGDIGQWLTIQLLAHFTQAQEDEEVHGVKNDTRAMVFCSFRHCVLEVVVSWGYRVFGKIS
jgi:hypothetical protein